jgi:hypothetical protein
MEVNTSHGAQQLETCVKAYGFPDGLTPCCSIVLHMHTFAAISRTPPFRKSPSSSHSTHTMCHSIHSNTLLVYNKGNVA